MLRARRGHQVTRQGRARAPKARRRGATYASSQRAAQLDSGGPCACARSLVWRPTVVAGRLAERGARGPSAGAAWRREEPPSPPHSRYQWHSSEVRAARGRVLPTFTIGVFSALSLLSAGQILHGHGHTANTLVKSEGSGAEEVGES